MQGKNTVFANIGDDSDDGLERLTKTAAKKVARKAPAGGAPTTAASSTKKDETDAFNLATKSAGAAADGDFQQSQQGRQPRPARGGAGGERRGRGERGGYGGRGRGGEGRGRGGAAARPRTAYKTDEEGNTVVDPARKERKPFAGKPREDGHPYDRRDGTGKGRRGDKKDGHGKGNWGKDGVYKPKGDGETKPEDKTEEAPVEEEKKVAEPEYREEILGQSLDDFLGGQTATDAKAARVANALTQKVQKSDTTKAKQSTVQQNSYLKGSMGKTAAVNGAFLGVQAEENDEAPRGGRRGDVGPQRGGRKQNAKQALRKTEEDFPTL